MRSQKRTAREVVPFVGAPGRRCRKCMRPLQDHLKVFWKRHKRDQYGNKIGPWKLMIRCTACNRIAGLVAKSAIPEDERLLPEKPPCFKQKGLFCDAGKEGAQVPDQLS